MKAIYKVLIAIYQILIAAFFMSLAVIFSGNPFIEVRILYPIFALASLIFIINSIGSVVKASVYFKQDLKLEKEKQISSQTPSLPMSN